MPFRRIIDRDDYPTWPSKGMTTARWMAEIEPEPVAIRDLSATQPQALLSALSEDHQRGAEPYEADPYPHVVALDGTLYLEDGHHRALRALLRGEETMMARVLRS